MPLPVGVEGRVASLSDLMDTDVGISGGTVTIDQIAVNNRPIWVGVQTDVSVDTLTTVTTVPANGVKYITKILCSGEDNGKWGLYIDTILKATLRTTDRNVAFDFNTPLKILSAEVVDIKVTHFSDDANADFQCTVFGYEAVEDIIPPAAIVDLGAS